MKNNYYSDYLSNEEFLEVVEEFMSKHDNNFDDIKDDIRRQVSNIVHNATGDHYDVADYIARAKSYLDVLQHINDLINAE
jgi:conjugal transfer/entry exclusion protein